MSSIKPIIKVAVAVLCIAILAQVLFDPLSSARHTFEVQRARAEFPEARAKWDATKIMDYRFEVRGYAPLACVVSAAIEVRNGSVVQVENIGFVPGDDSSSYLLPPEEWATP